MYISTTNSTNTLLKERLVKGEWPEGERFLRAGFQTAGRGQTGNGWESENGKNLLCSILIPPCANLFELNVLVSVAACLTALTVLQQSDLTAKRSYSEAISIKWPNDIYWGDKKIAGILIENAIIGGEIKYSIAGIGLNVNQIAWHGDAPNPVSLKQITGKEYDLDELMGRLMEQIEKAFSQPQEQVWEYYRTHLYRREGYWPFVEREVSVAPTMNAGPQSPGQFLARIENVLPTGEIVLEDQNGNQRKYHFKQVRYVI